MTVAAHGGLTATSDRLGLAHADTLWRAMVELSTDPAGMNELSATGLATRYQYPKILGLMMFVEGRSRKPPAP